MQRPAVAVRGDPVRVRALQRRAGSAISVDGAWCHRAFAEARGISFPLLADFEPKGEVSRKYGVYRSGEGVSERGLFVLDPQGVVVWSEVVEPEVNPGADGILNAPETLSLDSTS